MPNKIHYKIASYIVFNAIIQNLNVDFPKPTGILIALGEESKIDGSWLPSKDFLEQNAHLEKLTDQESQVIQLFYSLVGYSYYPVFVGKGKSITSLDSANITLNIPSINKADRIASLITGVSDLPDWKINPQNLQILTNINQDVTEILELDIVKETIEFIVNEIIKEANNKGRIEINGQDFDILFNDACEKVTSENIQPYIDANLTKK